jgi:hypothetical protein
MNKKIPNNLKEAAMEELQKFQKSLQNLAETWDIPAWLLFDFVGLATPSIKEDGRMFNKWMEYQRQNFSAAVEEARRRSVSTSSLDVLETSVTFPEPSAFPKPSAFPEPSADTSSSTTNSSMVFSSRKPLFAEAVGILSEWYRKRTPDEDLQLQQKAADELQLRKEAKTGSKRGGSAISRIPANPKRMKVDSQRAADTHIQQIRVHLSALHAGFGIHSLVVIVGGGYRSMTAGTLTHPNLPYIKLFSKLVMPLNEFQTKLESAVTMGELTEQGVFGDKVKVVIKDACKDKKAKAAHVIRLKELGDRLRALFGKYKH